MAHYMRWAPGDCPGEKEASSCKAQESFLINQPAGLRSDLILRIDGGYLFTEELDHIEMAVSGRPV